MSKTVVRNLDLILTMDDDGTEIQNGDIVIQGSSIASVGKGLHMGPDDRVIPGEGKVALPGFVNTHHHLYQIFTRDLPRLVDSPDLFDWLEVSYEVWHELTPEHVYISALVGLGLLLKTGCTLSSDLYYVFPDSSDGDFIDAEIRAAQEIGIRFHPTRGGMSLSRDKGGLPPKNVTQCDEAILLDYERLVSKYHDPSPLSMIRIGLAPCSPFSVTPQLMRETIEFARMNDLHCHTHMAESPLEEQWCAEKYGMRPLEYMESLDWIGPDVWYAHAIYLTDEEIRRMGGYRCGVASCPVCNARSAEGVARILEMKDQGVRIGFGVDGVGGYGDVFSEMQTAFTLHRLHSEARASLDREIIWIATRGGAEVLGWDRVGSLQPGNAADVILIDTRQLDYAGSPHDLPTSIVQFGVNRMVDTAIVNGEVVAERGSLTKVDEGWLIDRANQLARELVANASARTGRDYLTGPYADEPRNRSREH